jgi:hypothetical protein
LADAEDVTIENVDIIRDMGWALFCRIGGKVRFVPQILLRTGSIRMPGERGAMVLPSWLAVGLGLPGNPDVELVPLTRSLLET